MSALVHFAVIDMHLREWVPTGVFFVVIGTLQLVLAVAVVSRGRRRVYQATIVVSLGILAVWAEPRLIGVPVGPDAWQPEPVGRADLISSVAEAVTVLLVLPMAFGPNVRAVRSGLTHPLSGAAQLSVLAALIAMTGWFTSAGLQAARDDAREHEAAEPGERIGPGEPPGTHGH